MKQYIMEPGSAYPIGTTVKNSGVNFALFSANAEKIELCIFDQQGQQELQRFVLPQCQHNIWHGFLNGAKAGLVYGYRVYGPYSPESGHRFNHHKLLLDPYAKALKGVFKWSDRHFAYNVTDPRQDLSFDVRDNADVMVKAIVFPVNGHPGVAIKPLRVGKIINHTIGNPRVIGQLFFSGFKGNDLTGGGITVFEDQTGDFNILA